MPDEKNTPSERQYEERAIQEAKRAMAEEAPDADAENRQAGEHQPAAGASADDPAQRETVPGDDQGVQT